MKNSKSLVLILTLICLCLATVTLLTACTPSNSGISFNTLTLKNNKATVKVSNATTEYSFVDEITVNGKADYIVALDLRGNNVVDSKVVTLKEGDNKVFIMETINGKEGNTYEITVRRRVMYEVTFNANGGKEVAAQTVEEDGLATSVETTKLGYDFKGWGFDFNTPITQDTTLNAKYNVKAEMSAFNFTSTATTCTINSVKDSNLVSAVIPDYVTAIANRAFYNCDRLVTVAMGNKIKSIGENAFSGCTSLESIVIPELVTEIAGKTFYECSSLESIVIPAAVKSIGKNAFSECVKLNSVTISNGVETIGEEAFSACSSLMSITIPESVVEIGKKAFLDCIKLVEVASQSSRIVLSKGDTANGYLAAYACNVFNVGDTFETKFSNDNGFIVYTNGTEKLLMAYNGTATELTLPENITNIYYRAFFDDANITSVVMGNNVRTISDRAFEYCNALKTVVFGSSVKTIGEYAFRGCMELVNLTLCDGLLTIGASAFRGCDRLEKLVIPDTVTTMGESAFENCSGLVIVTISNSLRQISPRAFFNCSSLKIIILGTSVNHISDHSFTGCSSVEAIYFRDSRTNMTGIYCDYEVNKELMTVQRYAYKETRPALNSNGTAYNGNYWHYDEDGNPVIWVFIP